MDILQIGATVREHRKRLRLTQAALATESQVSRATLAALETGSLAELGVGKLLRILSRLGMTLTVEPDSAYRPTMEQLEHQRLDNQPASPSRYRT